MNKYEEVMNKILQEYRGSIEGKFSIDGVEIHTGNGVEQTESPIEELLYIQLKHSMMMSGGYGSGLYERLTPQYEIKKDNSHIRVDFLYEIVSQIEKESVLKIVIECDGHDFHEKTKEQARKDKCRDRLLSLNSYLVLRFTGSEIYRNSKECVKEINDFVAEKLWGDEIRDNEIRRH